jgi:proteasome accessory factor B
MLRIHKALASGQYPNATILAREEEVATKTIHRDIEFMRERMGMPIQYDSVRPGYFYTSAVSGFPNIQITEGELFALLIAEKALRQYRGTSFEQPLLSALYKMEQSLPDTISLNLGDLNQTISFRTRAEPILNLEVFDVLTKAAARHEELEMVYRKPGVGKNEIRLVDPYHLGNINGEWYLFAYDQGRKDIRTFVPARIQSVRLTGKTFPPPDKFSLEKRLKDSFGVYSGQGEYLVVVRFSARVADYIREKKWHDSQKLKELKDGGVELTLKLSSLVEIERWVLGWGGDATVVKPPELIAAIRKTAREILNQKAE